jgi:hypothetical protein
MAWNTRDDGTPEYLVKWVGYREKTWEPSDSLMPTTIRRYHRAISRDRRRRRGVAGVSEGDTSDSVGEV